MWGISSGRWATGCCEANGELAVIYQPGWPRRGVWGEMDTCICMAESFHSSPETITILFIHDTPIQNKKLKMLTLQLEY